MATKCQVVTAGLFDRLVVVTNDIPVIGTTRELHAHFRTTAAPSPTGYPELPKRTLCDYKRSNALLDACRGGHWTLRHLLVPSTTRTGNGLFPSVKPTRNACPMARYRVALSVQSLTSVENDAERSKRGSERVRESDGRKRATITAIFSGPGTWTIERLRSCVHAFARGPSVNLPPPIPFAQLPMRCAHNMTRRNRLIMR
jgi:hypothetical protein